MARVTSIFSIEGTIGELTFYKHRNGKHFVRGKSSLTKERVASDSAFARTRENSREFADLNRAGKLIRQGCRGLLLRAKDPKLLQRMVKVLMQVKAQDLASERGKRSVAKGLLTAEGRRLLTGFDFNSRSTLGSVLLCPYVLESDYVVGLPSLVPSTMLQYPKAATHVAFQTGLLEVDFEQGSTVLHCSSSQQLPLDFSPIDLQLSLDHIPSDSGIHFWMLLVEFLQEVNGTLYPLHDQSHTVLTVVDVASQ